MSLTAAIDLKDLIRTIPDYPKPGIMFRDITTLLATLMAFATASSSSRVPSPIAGCRRWPASRRAASSSAARLPTGLRCGFVPIRKKGKLPGKAIGQDYELEYGIDVIEIHEDAIAANEPVLLVDDLIATGGTAEAAVKLLRKLKAEVVGAAFVIDLPDLGGSGRLARHGIECHTLMTFEDD
jgi:adenine phosphoribosyltransferase